MTKNKKNHASTELYMTILISVTVSRVQVEYEPA